MMPLWLGRQKDSEQVFPAGLCVALTPHHQGFTSPIYLILFSPPTHAPLFMHYVKKKKNWDCFLLSFLTIYLPPPSCSLPIFRSFSSLPLPSFYIFFPSLLSLSFSSGPSPCFHLFCPLWTGVCTRACVCVCVNLSEISLFFVDWLPARTVKALPAAKTWKMHRISLW